jgi:hypothetical protein
MRETGDGPKRIDMAKQLEILEKQDPKTFELARFLGARNELYYILLRRNWAKEEAEKVYQIKSWTELSKFLSDNNISEIEDLDSDFMVVSWFDLLTQKAGLKEEFKDIDTELPHE